MINTWEVICCPKCGICFWSVLWTGDTASCVSNEISRLKAELAVKDRALDMAVKGAGCGLEYGANTCSVADRIDKNNGVSTEEDDETCHLCRKKNLLSLAKKELEEEGR